MTERKTQPAVGIDLGTTFSAVAYLTPDGRPETIRNSEGDLTTPSAVFFDHQRPIVGIEAVEAGLLEPDRIAQFAKRDVGESVYEKMIRGKYLPAEIIQALVLRKLKNDAELKLGRINEAVITVPAYFNEPCRKATQDAGRLAGLNVLDIINEPTAAAITYGVEQGFLNEDGNSTDSERVLVYDLGGGTFDVTVMEIKEGHFNTIATAGDVYLGGIDWDSRLVDLIAEAFHREHGIDPREDPQAEQELLRKANQTKHALTQRDSVVVAFANGGRRMRTEISQRDFSNRCADLVERTLMTVRLVLDDANTDWSQLTRLILVGGSTRMPMVREELQRLSGMELDRSLSPDEAVSHGAALYAGMLQSGNEGGTGISVSNVNSHDLGVLAVDPKTDRPKRKIMIPRNSPLPAQKMVRFRTQVDSQANVKIEVVEGGDDRGINATRIGKCVVKDIPKGTPKGTAVEVRFDYKPDGRLTIHASLPDIERKISMALNRASGLTDDEIAFWSGKLDEGLTDAALAGLPDPKAQDEASDDHTQAKTESGPSTSLPSVAKPPMPPAPSMTTSNAAAILNMPGVSKPTAAAKSEIGSASPVVESIQIDVASETSPVPLSVEDAKSLTSAVGNQPSLVREPVDLELETDNQTPSNKADSDDLKRLASLGAGSDRTAPMPSEVPVIMTSVSHSDESRGSKSRRDKSKSKRSGGLFGRKKS